jgi:hypothetical protein
MSPSQQDNDFAPAKYQDNALSLQSTSDQESELYNDDGRDNSIDTFKINDFDLSLLRDEEAQEQLLAKRDQVGGAGHGSQGHRAHAGMGGKRASKPERKRRARFKRYVDGENDEEGGLMFEMEEGFKNTSSSSSSDSSPLKDFDQQRRQARKVTIACSS